MQSFKEQLGDHIEFSYSCFDRVVLRGYMPHLFFEGSVVKLLRNLGFKRHTNGVFKLLTDQFNAHIKKVSEKQNIPIHWWGQPEKDAYHCKLEFVQDKYSRELKQIRKTDKVLCIIKSLENTRTFANKEIKTKAGKTFTKLYACNKFVSHYYVYIQDKELGLCYLKLSSYLPFVCEFYMNGHNYLKQQFDKENIGYKMQDNSFISVSCKETLERLVNDFQPSIILNRIDYWMDVFFRFDKGAKSTCSKLLRHTWYTYQTEISTNIKFKSAKFAKTYFDQVLQKHHTIGLPDRLTKIFGLSRPVNQSKSTQNTYRVQACIKHWLKGNSIKFYNKSGCLLRVETTINRPDLPGLKLKKPACNLQAYYWYGHKCNSRYLDTICDVDLSLLTTEVFDKYRNPIITGKGVRVAAPDLRKSHQMELTEVLLCASYFAMGFRSKDLRTKLGDGWKTAKIAYELRKLRERGAIKKKQNSHYYQLTHEGYVWLYYSIFNYSYFINPLLSANYKKAAKKSVANPSKIEVAYSQINSAVSIVTKGLGLAA